MASTRNRPITLLCIWLLDFDCRKSHPWPFPCKQWLAKRSSWKLNQRIPLTVWRREFKRYWGFRQTNKFSFLITSHWKIMAFWATTTSSMNPLSSCYPWKLQSGKTISLPLYPGCTVEGMKQLIQNQEGISPEQQRLMFEGKELEGDATLEYYNILSNLILEQGSYTIKEHWTCNFDLWSVTLR